jgi:LemA protein
MIALLVVPLLLVLALIAGVAYGYFSTNNRLMALDTRCDTAFADIDVYLKHRHNLIPGLVETVRGFASHEKDILTQVTQARAEALAAAIPDGKVASEKLLSKSITSLMSVAERYPELKASSHFASLREELSESENRITAARRFYNLAIDEFNATLRQFPGSYIGRMKHLAARQPFDLGIERVLLDEPVAIKF